MSADDWTHPQAIGIACRRCKWDISEHSTANMRPRPESGCIGFVPPRTPQEVGTFGDRGDTMRNNRHLSNGERVQRPIPRYGYERSTVSLPPELGDYIEAQVAAGEKRSAVVARAVRLLVESGQ